MMKCRLFTKAHEHVVDVEIPPFNEPPDVLIWGERIFKLVNTTAGFVEPEYTEAFSYWVKPEHD